ncbi:uncharacterized protein Nmag_1732 [Natrialba magadii ATCC 43099]|uniref:Uncharacterized protein n=1 Tax=Natrialba magadii (strain ATCC 43099 / DSM 3394 / CCM 3739 / CIP 104546 / IAM 13178 / JCM 8861 / NBRC 102185 / NCIMB 2190 / MS3) TaxID=547559 RepID=D3SUQ0_NATMM|nr:hypothetical protein [Natrialba magadii]ADD05308.1 uncharacterized protein Nmag_1732 [Natrialba magadii ATCC 43099]ELY29143.1 hypothetical protein C500_11685 [Natrialba magadii ATCC 43099]
MRRIDLLFFDAPDEFAVLRLVGSVCFRVGAPLQLILSIVTVVGIAFLRGI